jgi:hypothetical protein
MPDIGFIVDDHDADVHGFPLSVNEAGRTGCGFSYDPRPGPACCAEYGVQLLP